MRWEDKIVQYMEKSADFMLENAPSFFQEIVAYGRAKALLFLVGTPVFLVAASCITYYSFRAKLHPKCWADVCGPGESHYIAGRIVGPLFMLISFIVFMCNIEAALMVWFAPKLYILKQIKS